MELTAKTRILFNKNNVCTSLSVLILNISVSKFLQMFTFYIKHHCPFLIPYEIQSFVVKLF